MSPESTNDPKFAADTSPDVTEFGVLYGSQTGTAEKLAHQLAKDVADRFDKSATVTTIDNYDFTAISSSDKEHLLILLVSTNGDGDPSDNAMKTFRYISDLCREPEHNQLLSRLRFGIFGLGNTAYDAYQGAARNYKTCLLDLGAHLVAPYGEGNDEKGELYEDFVSWKSKFLVNMGSECNWKVIKEDQYTPLYQIQPVSARKHTDGQLVASLRDLDFLDRPPFHMAKPFMAPIRSCRIFTSGERCQFHCELDLEGSRLRYQTGDHIGIYPTNRIADVEQFLFAFGLLDRKDEIVQVRSSTPLWFVTPTTYVAIARHYLSINSPVSSEIIQQISKFSPSKEAREKLELLASREQFVKKVIKRKQTLYRLLLDVSSGQPWPDVPFSLLLESLGKLQPRFYSVASSNLMYENQAHISVKCERETIDNDAFYGVCSNFIEEACFKSSNLYLNPDSSIKLPLYIRRSNFKPPVRKDRPIIMICAGTGIAPFRGFIQERIAQSKSGAVGKNLLFFGCRDENDALYSDDIAQYQKQLGSSLEVQLAYSRADPSHKIYVQEKVREHAIQVYALITQGAYIYVCGNSVKLSSSMNRLMRELLIRQGGASEIEAAKELKQFRLSGRYQEDLW